MRILINALSASQGGGVTALRRLLPAMIEVDEGKHTYVVLAKPGRRRELETEHERIGFVGLIPGVRASWEERLLQSRIGRVAAEQLAVPIGAAFRGADVVLSPAGLATFVCPVPQVLLFQNVAPFTPKVVSQYAGTPNEMRMPLLRWLGILSAHAADRIVFISDGQQQVIAPQLGAAASRACRIYLGRSAAFTPRAEAEAAPVLRRHGIDRPYLLSVSHFYRYQNLVELVSGFGLASRALPTDLRLVLAGPEVEADYAASVREAARIHGISDRILYLGQVPYDDLPTLYAAAEMFLFSTTCESFPNTLVEALASGVPTLSSDSAPMPELAGAAAQYFDANAPADIAAKIIALWSDREGRQALGRAGVERASRFSWQTTARELLTVLESAANRGA